MEPSSATGELGAMLRTAADFASGGGEQREAEGMTRIGQDFAIELAQVWPQKKWNAISLFHSLVKASKVATGYLQAAKQLEVGFLKLG
jgi:hypothetical protein